jgi:phage terminase large subunit-like protein
VWQKWKLVSRNTKVGAIIPLWNRMWDQAATEQNKKWDYAVGNCTCRTWRFWEQLHV